MAVLDLIHRAACRLTEGLLAFALLLSIGQLVVAADEPLPATAASGSAASRAPRGTIPAALRAEWEVSFPEEISVVEYARRLDYFGIEISAVSPNGKIEYISNSGQQKPDKRVGQLVDDPRLYIGWRRGELVAADRKLLAKAGINAKGKQLWHFFPEETQRLMATLERAHAKRDPTRIKRTRFELRRKPNGDGYEFVVAEQEYREGETAATPAKNTSPGDER